MQMADTLGLTQNQGVSHFKWVCAICHLQYNIATLKMQ